MSDSFIIDTSAWIEASRRGASEKLIGLVNEILPLGICSVSSVSAFELLRVAKSSAEFKRLKRELEALSIRLVDSECWELGYQISFELGRKGITIPMADVLIACQAYQNGSILLHHDKHFNLIKKVLKFTTRDFLMNR